MLFTRQKKIADLRKNRRHSLIYQPTVLDGDTEQLIGHLIDISPCGAMLVSERSTQPGVIMNLRIVLPSPFMGAAWFEVQAQTTRVSNDVNSDYFDIGLRFLESDDTIQQFIEYLIEAYTL